MLKDYNGFTGAQREKGSRILKKAITEGRIPDPMTLPCAICGQTEGIRHYHNEDYSEEHVIEDAKPICWRCHMLLHKRYSHPLSFCKYMIDVTLYHKQYPPVYKPNDWGKLTEHYID